MVKGISRQVIVIDTPEPKLFEQAIFILRDNAQEVTDEALLKEAKEAIRGYDNVSKKRQLYLQGAVWASGGAMLTGLAWLLTVLL
jgi:hypothetical protein